MNFNDDKKPSAASRNLDLYLLLSRLLFQNGASASRIIDSVARLRTYLGDPDVNVMLAYEAISVTLESNNRLETKVGRRRSVAVMNVRVLAGISYLLETMKARNLDVVDIRRELKQLTDDEKLNWPLWVTTIALAFAAAGFGLLNGADYWALAAIMPSALLIGYLRHYFTHIKFHSHAALFLSTMIGTIVCSSLLNFTETSTSLVAIIAILLPLVPGFPLINGGIDIFCNYNSIGLGRWIFAMMTVWILLISLAIPMHIYPKEFTNIAIYHSDGIVYTVIRDGLIAGIASLALAIMMKSPLRMWLWFFCGGLLARAIRTYLVFGLHYSLPGGAFWGAVVVSCLAFFAGNYYRVPASICAMICVLPMIPGYLIINGVNNLLYLLDMGHLQNITFSFTMQTASFLLNSIYIIAALITGIIFPLMVIQRRLPRI